MPRFLDGVDERPSFFDLVPARKECGVAAHRIEEQAFVRFRAGFAKGSAIVKIHLHRFDAQTGSRNFCQHSQ